jgi:hypothetical protein
MLSVVLLSLSVFYAGGVDSKVSEQDVNCCVNHHEKPSNPLEKANYDCSSLNSFGQDRCDQVYGGNVCKWVSGDRCFNKKCSRSSKFELHYGKYVDVGLCGGNCGSDNLVCNPNLYTELSIEGTDSSISVIKDCICDACSAIPLSINVAVPVDRCKGDCDNEQRNRVCSAGVADQFSLSNGAEPSNPSSALVSGYLSGCSAGIQTGFDIFIDNRCFGHTFTDCFIDGECPLRSARLRICIKAANVFLTQTDSLSLGINGAGLWGMGLPALNGGTWNQGEEMCLDLDLSNLPGSGANILLDIQMAGHLDVMVQDDSAVDFLNLAISYDNCLRCVPKLTSMSHLYTEGGVKDFKRAEVCDCVRLGNCVRLPHNITYFEGTMFETTIDVGQCLGRCNKFLRCNQIKSKQKIEAPEGDRVIEVVKACRCGKHQWNPHGLYVKE